MGETLRFNASAESLDEGDNRKGFFDLSGILDVALEDAELRIVDGPRDIVLAASQANFQVTLPAGMTTGKLICLKTSDPITLKRDSTLICDDLQIQWHRLSHFARSA